MNHPSMVPCVSIMLLKTGIGKKLEYATKGRPLSVRWL